MKESFAGKIALVTGGTGGIGKAAALAFARYGAQGWSLAVDGLSKAQKHCV